MTHWKELEDIADKASKIVAKNVDKITPQENMTLVKYWRAIGKLWSKALYQRDIKEIDSYAERHEGIIEHRGKTNGDTGKPYTEKESEAIAYRKQKPILQERADWNAFTVRCKIECDALSAAVVNIRQHQKPRYNLSDTDLNILEEINTND